ncbi:hypothetical protein [Pseudomonas silesiensis]
MTEIIVAIIGCLATITSAALPAFLEKKNIKAGGLLKKTPLPTIAILGVVSVAASYSAASTCFDATNHWSISSLPIYFALGICGIASVFYGYSAHTWSETIGVYVGYCSGIACGGFIVWWLISDWSSNFHGRSVINLAEVECAPNYLFTTALIIGVFISGLKLYKQRLNKP